jgi:truncated hemoglobin YjbI
MERVRPVGRLCQQADGPFQYTGKELDEVHKDLHITSEELDEVGAEIGRALNDLNVPERERQEVLAAIVARKDEVVHQSQ